MRYRIFTFDTVEIIREFVITNWMALQIKARQVNTSLNRPRACARCLKYVLTLILYFRNLVQNRKTITA